MNHIILTFLFILISTNSSIKDNLPKNLLIKLKLTSNSLNVSRKLINANFLNAVETAFGSSNLPLSSGIQQSLSKTLSSPISNPSLFFAAQGHLEGKGELGGLEGSGGSVGSGGSSSNRSQNKKGGIKKNVSGSKDGLSKDSSSLNPSSLKFNSDKSERSLFSSKPCPKKKSKPFCPEKIEKPICPKNKVQKPPASSLSPTSRGITVDAPVAPIAILPPKPVIIAPLLVRANQRKRKTMIIRKGNYESYGKHIPYPNHYPPYFPLHRSLNQNPYAIPYPLNANRSLMGGQQIIFQSISQPDPELWENLKISQVPPALYPTTKTAKDAEELEANNQLVRFEDMANKLKELNKETVDLHSDVEKISFENLKSSDAFGSSIDSLLNLKNEAIALGIGGI